MSDDDAEQEEREERARLKIEWMKASCQQRDEDVLKALRKEGFCLVLPPAGPPGNATLDLCSLWPWLDGCPNLVVSVPHQAQCNVKTAIKALERCQFDDGTVITVLEDEAFEPIPENWFRSKTEIIHLPGPVADPPFAQGGLNREHWGHYAELSLRRGQTETKLSLIHVGLGPDRDRVLLDFLAPHRLLPRTLFL